MKTPVKNRNIYELITPEVIQNTLKNALKRGYRLDIPTAINESVLNGTHELLQKPNFTESDLRKIISYVNSAEIDSYNKIDATKTKLDELTYKELNTIILRLTQLYNSILSNFRIRNEFFPTPEFNCVLSDLQTLIRKFAFYNYLTHKLDPNADCFFILLNEYNFILNLRGELNLIPNEKKSKLPSKNYRTNAIRDYYGSMEEYHNAVV